MNDILILASNRMLPTNELVYCQVCQDLTSQAIISFVTNNTTRHDHSLFYRVSGTNDQWNEVIPDQKHIVDTQGKRLNNSYLTGLQSDTVYEFKIGNEIVLRKYKTMPSTLNNYNEVKVGYATDPHFRKKGHMDYGELTDVMRVRGIDILVCGGDIVDCEGRTSTTGGEVIGTGKESNDWIDFLKMIETRLCAGKKYIPFITIVGNHDTDPHFSDNPEAAYHIRFFFDYPKESHPVGKNYGAITIGDYCQFLLYDTHTVVDADDWHAMTPIYKDWFDEVHDQTVKHCIPFAHAGILTSYRNAISTFPLVMTYAVAERFYENDNIRTLFTGHDHSWMKTRPLRVVNQQPSHGSNEPDNGYIDLQNGKYLTLSDQEDNKSFYVLGNGGWGGSVYDIFNPATTWYLENVRSGRTFGAVAKIKTGVSGVEHEDDGKDANPPWAHVHILTLKDDAMIVESVDQYNNIFDTLTLDI